MRNGRPANRNSREVKNLRALPLFPPGSLPTALDMIASMRVSRGLVLALGIPALLLLTAASTFAASSPSPSSSGSQASGAPALPGDPTKGATLYAQTCATCHRSVLEGA